jgi:hypothetical protein
VAINTIRGAELDGLLSERVGQGVAEIRSNGVKREWCITAAWREKRLIKCCVSEEIFQAFNVICMFSARCMDTTSDNSIPADGTLRASVYSFVEVKMR